MISIQIKYIYAFDSPQLVSSRELDTARVCGSAASNLHLEAADVRLWVAGTGVERNSLSPDEILTRCQALWHGECALSAVCVEDLSTPR